MIIKYNINIIFNFIVKILQYIILILLLEIMHLYVKKSTAEQIYINDLLNRLPKLYFNNNILISKVKQFHICILTNARINK